MTEVIAVEPESFLRERAVRAAHAAQMAIRVVDGTADALRDHTPERPPVTIEVRTGDQPVLIQTVDGAVRVRPGTAAMELPTVVPRPAWLAARKALLTKEKEFTRARDALSAKRRGLPMVKIDKEYLFEGPDGTTTLLDLFEGRRQLIICHFMFEPSWDDGCVSCSYFAGNFAGAIAHLPARGTAFAVVSRAPIAKIGAFKQRMGWTFPWLSSFETDFNYDFHVTLDETVGSVEYNYEDAAALKQAGKLWMDELPGLSVFLRDGDVIFHTYSTYHRGLDLLINTYNYLDLTPFGRQEDHEEWAMAWVRHHDRCATS